MSDESPAAGLKGHQRKWLRGRAHGLEPVVHVGRQGVTDQVLAAVHAELLSHELIKVKLHAPDDKRAMAEEIARRCGAELAGLVGHVAIVYKAHPETPRLVVPASASGG